MDVVQFEVPLSLPDSSLQHPHPDEQFPVDPTSIQGTGGATSIGNDWAYFGAFANPNTGLTPYQEQGGVAFDLANPPAVMSQDIRITGNGSTDGALAPLEWYLVQKTHIGPFVSNVANRLQYATDTTGGNSGSPVILESTGEAIGIHTNAGCSAGGGANSGTANTNAGLQAALANPLGICAPKPLSFTFPNGLPELLPESGAVIRVEVSGINGGVPQAATGMLHFEDSGGPQVIAMTQVSPNVYDAEFPELTCGDLVTYYFSALDDQGAMCTSTDQAPHFDFEAWVGDGFSHTWIDDFSTNMGWTVFNDPALVDGGWEQGIPAGAGVRGDPPYDADGSDWCFLTDNVAGNSDVDGGPTILTSPALNASTAEAHISYQRWYDTSLSTAQDDQLVVEVSGNNGGSWVEVERIGPTGPETEGGWFRHTFRVADFVTPGNQVRLRFIADDANTGSVLEAAVDDVRVLPDSTLTTCSAVAICLGDFDGNMTVDIDDFYLGLTYWQSILLGDMNSDSITNVLDYIMLLDNQGPCP
jgi:hypothetical protein